MLKTHTHFFDEIYVSNKKDGEYIYIDACNGNAGSLFNISLNKDIYVDGFICDDIEGTLFNKSTIKHEQVKNEDNIKVVKSVNDLLTLNTDRVNTDNIIVYGAGKIGIDVIKCLEGMGMPPRYVVDSFKIGQNILGYTVASPFVIEDNKEDSTIIIAMAQYANVLDKILSTGVNNDNVFVHNYEFKNYENYVYIDRMGGEFITKVELLYIASLNAKPLYVLWEKKYYDKLKKILFNLNISIKGCIFLGDNEFCDNAEFCDIEDLLYEDEFVVLVGRSGPQLIAQFEDLGLDTDNVESIFSAPMDRRFMYKPAIEVNIGQSYVSDNTYAGMAKYGDGNTTIFITGGSTTDATLYSFKSWPEIMYSRIKNPEKYVIYNAGVWGYNSAQELYRLIQDGVPLSSDIVISFSGVNDMLGRNRRPYTRGYSELIYNFASQHMQDADYPTVRMQDVEVFTGVESSEDYFDIWLDNMLYMHAICQVKNIRFYAFLQPSIFSQIGISALDKLALELSHAPTAGLNFEWAERFRKRIKNVINKYDFIFDLSDIFDYMNNIYFDNAHVLEEGNSIIADNIIEILRKAGEKL